MPFFYQVKVRILLIFLFLGVIQLSFAQVLIGPVAGINYSWIKFGDRDNLDTFRVAPVVGFHAGAMLSFRVQKRFFLNTSLIYSQKGKSITGKVDKELKNKVVYNYIEMPISYTAEFKSTVGANKVFKWYLGMGPNVSYWLGGKGTLQNSDLKEVEIQRLPYRVTFHNDNPNANQMNVNNANRFQFGLNVTAGVAFEPWEGYKKFVLTVRYEIGHSYMSKSSRGTFTNIGTQNVTYQDELRSRNMGFRISLAYLFDLKTEQRKKGKSTSKISKKKRR